MKWFEHRFGYRNMAAFFIDAEVDKDGSAPEPAFPDCVVEESRTTSSVILPGDLIPEAIPWL